MAYAAAIFLKHTIQQLLDSCDILLDPPSKKIIEYAYKEAISVHRHLNTLDRTSRKRPVKAVEERLRELICKLEDVIESQILNQLHSQSEGGTHQPLTFFVDMQDLKPEIHTLVAALKKMKMVYLRESRDIHDDDDGDVPSRLIGSDGNKPKIVGFSDLISYIKGVLTFPKDHDGTEILSLVGMAGIGKTTLAKQIFEDPDIVEHFECRVWVRLGRKKLHHYEMLRWFLAQLNPDSDRLVTSQGDNDIGQDVRNTLKNKRCFIVLDDVWDTDFIYSMKVNGQCKSRVLFSTRLQQVADQLEHEWFPPPHNIKMLLLNKEDSWHLFCAKVFAEPEESCPPELEKPGKEIVEKCEGLPLLIVTIANLLSSAGRDPEYWNKVAKDKKNQLLKDACKEIEQVLFPSYHYLPQYLKTCFLYMGVFPQDCEIPKSNIINLWIAEGFLEVDEYRKRSDDYATNCLTKLVQNNVLLVYQRTRSFITNGIKTCGLHCSFWYLCNREAEKNKFLHVFNNVEDGLEEVINGHRRLCIHNNVLFGIKDVYNSIERVCASTARSLLCFGPYHQYEVPTCFGLRLLKVLDALAIRFYDFPLEMLKLVLLKYLAFTCNSKLPPSISKLWKLQFLIVGRHLSIKSSRTPSYLPIEIWDMKELQHLQIMGSDLPDPCGNLLPKLLKLVGVSSHSCSKEVLEGIPNLQKLGIQMELEPNAIEPLYCIDHISNLYNLQSFKCAVVNPKFVNPPKTTPFSMIPSCLGKLHLSGLCYPWKYMTTIASLPNLKELKLRCYAFRGPKWEIEKYHFPVLAFLLIEDTDLVQLKAGSRCLAYLRDISMKHCYRLQELHLETRGYYETLEQIELVDCNPVAVNYVRQAIEDGSVRIPKDGLVVRSSWNDGNHKLSQPTNWLKREPTKWPKRKFLKPW